jgi:hypothetical protein
MNCTENINNICDRYADITYCNERISELYFVKYYAYTSVFAKTKEEIENLKKNRTLIEVLRFLSPVYF